MTDQEFPSKIGRYEIVEKVGHGGMATVLKACDPNFEREVAVKVMPQSFLHDPKFRKRFEREGKMIARLEHYAIVPVYDFGEDNGQPYIVMRLMTGGDLATRIKNGSLSQEEAGRILIRIADALDIAHSNGVIHRDMKPGNILFDNYGDAYLSDFGIARMVESDTTLTGSSIIGTPSYMSPEQIQGEKDIDGRSDIYSLGVILYQMLSGEMPFSAETPGKVMMQHILEPVPDISTRHPDIPPAVSAVISKAMAKTPQDRYQTGKEMAAAYETAAQVATQESSPPLADQKVADEPHTTVYKAADVRSTTEATSDISKDSQSEIAPTGKFEQQAGSIQTDVEKVPAAMTNAHQAASPENVVSQQRLETAKDERTGVQQKKRNPLVWALPLAILIIAGGFFGFTFANRSGSAAVPVADLETTATESIIQATNTPVPTEIIETPTSPPPSATIAPTETQIPATPTSAGLSEAELLAFMNSANILVFEDMAGDYTEAPYVSQTLDNMGLTYQWDGNAKGRFFSNFSNGPAGGGTWDLVIVAQEDRNTSSTDVIEYIIAALEQGSSVIYEAWYLDHSQTDTVKDLLDNCGVQVKEYLPNKRSDLDLLAWSISGVEHPILSNPNDGFSFSKANTKWMDTDDLGDLMSLTGSQDAEILIGLDPLNDAQKGVLATCMEDQLTLMTFSSHSYDFNTITSLWENMITNALNRRANYLNNQAE
jgi:serine/threonine protein kinase